MNPLEFQHTAARAFLQRTRVLHRMWVIIWGVLLSSALTIQAAEPQGSVLNPDFTQGGVIPEHANHTWNLGATGARGWMYSERLCTSEARQIAIVEVAKDSPAEGVLSEGDVILGVQGKPFSFDPRTEFGQALTSAEETGELSLIRWRAGKQDTVVVKLPVLGAYSSTAPYDCPKSKKILELSSAALAQRMADPNYTRQNAIPRCLNALGLLATGQKQYWPLIKKEAEWAAKFQVEDMATWYYGYVSIFLSEYVIATGDTSVLPGLERIVREAADGQSIVGSWGHAFARDDGRLAGYGMMNSPGVPLTIGMILARKAGVKDEHVDRAIERSAKLIRFYIGKGAVPYGDHHPWTQTHEDNGKCGMAAVMFNELGEAEGAEFFARMALASYGAERDTGHTGNYFNMAWAMPAVALSGPQATGAWMDEFGAWYFDLSRRHDGSFVYLGPPQIKRDVYNNWDCTGLYLIAYAMPLKAIHLTGKGDVTVPTLSESQSQAVIEDGRGWSNLDRNSYYDQLSEKQLLDRLGSWSPTVRARSAMALARRKAEVVPALVEMLDAPQLEAKIGACEALAMLRGKASPALPKLTATLDHSDMWLRIKAAEALAAMGQPAMDTVPQLLEMLSQGPTADDPRGMEQRYLMFAVFGDMLRRSLDNVDKERLRQAVAAGLNNEDGRARGSVNNIYKLLSYEEIQPLLPAVHQAVVEPSPSGIMFADEIRIEGLRLLAAHRVEEGVDACADYILTQNHWGSEKRTPVILEILLKYGAAAKPAIPKLEQAAAAFERGEPSSFPKRLNLQKAQAVREAIATIEEAKTSPQLIRIHD